MISSNSRLFAKRGNPWVSERERLSDFGRREYENPDLDRFTRARMSDRPLDGIALDIKRIDINKRNQSADEKAAKKLADGKTLRQRKLAGILNRMNAKLREHK